MQSFVRSSFSRPTRKPVPPAPSRARHTASKENMGYNREISCFGHRIVRYNPPHPCLPSLVWLNSDYVDELTVNLQHNVKINCLPRVEATKRQPDEILDTPAAGAAQQREDSVAQRRLMLRPLSCARARVCKLDWTDYEHDGMRQCQEGGGKGGEGQGAMGWWWDDTGCEAHDTLGATCSWSSYLCARQLLCCRSLATAVTCVLVGAQVLRSIHPSKMQRVPPALSAWPSRVGAFPDSDV